MMLKYDPHFCKNTNTHKSIGSTDRVDRTNLSFCNCTMHSAPGHNDSHQRDYMKQTTHKLHGAAIFLLLVCKFSLCLQPL